MLRWTDRDAREVKEFLFEHEDVSVIVAGGAGKHSCWQPTFGDGTRPVRRTIARRDGSPLRRVADGQR